MRDTFWVRVSGTTEWPADLHIVRKAAFEPKWQIKDEKTTINIGDVPPESHYHFFTTLWVTHQQLYDSGHSFL